MSSSAPALQGSFGKYRIIEKLGEGGMGAVYLATDTKLERKVALKVPHPTDAEGLARFYREAKAIAALDHPGICKIHEFDQVDGQHYLAMAYVEGQPLSAPVKGGRAWPQRLAAELIRRLAAAMQYAHSRQVIHRDLKPSNILIDGQHEPIIVDFGLARRLDNDSTLLSRPGMGMGTPAYMAPEQVRGDTQAMGPACDIYSLGVIFYQLLTGHLPYEEYGGEMVIEKCLKDPRSPSAHRSGLDREAEAICLKAMARNAADRYDSMSALVEALTNYLGGRVTLIHLPEPKRRRWLGRVLDTTIWLPSRVGMSGTMLVGRGSWTVLRFLFGPKLWRYTLFFLMLSAIGLGFHVNSKHPDYSSWSLVDTVEKAHADSITTVVFSSNGRRIASTGKEQAIKVWDVVGDLKGTKILQQSVLHIAAQVVAFSGDAKQLAFMSKKGTIRPTWEVKLWDLRAEGEVKPGPISKVQLACLAFCPDDRRLVAGAADQKVKMWELEKPEMRRDLPGPKTTVWSVAFHPTENQLFTGSKDGTAIIWDLATEKCLRFLPHSGAVCSVAFTANGHSVVTLDDEGAKEWDLRSETETLQPRVVVPLRAHREVRSKAISPDGQFLVEGYKDGTLKLWLRNRPSTESPANEAIRE